MTTVEEERPTKIRKTTLYSGYSPKNQWPFPHEVLCLIFQHLDNTDLLNLSCVSNLFRKLLKPYVFIDVAVKWDMILEKFPNKTEQVYDDDLLLSSIGNYVESLKVIEPNLSYEWNFRFHRLFQSFKNLKTLKLYVSNSSNFLKYNEIIPNLEVLELKTFTDSESGADFNLNHLKIFPNIKHLTIDGFCIDFDEEDLEGLTFNIKELNLVNCSWNYPFQLANFGNSQIEHMKLIYSNQFILSERFKEFLHNPNLPNLKYLTISNQNSLRLHITYRIFNFLQNIPNLKRLYLSGNIYNETLNHFTHVDIENKLRYILHINDVKIFYSSFVQS